MKKAKEFYDRYILPHADPDTITVTFPDLFASIPDRVSTLAVPMRISLLKIVENNETLQILTPADIGIDVCNEYRKYLSVKFKVYDDRRLCFIFVEDMPVLIDYSEASNWRHGPIIDMRRHCGEDAIQAVIKFHYDNSSSDGCFCPVYPFLYPGPNDYRDFPEFRKEENYQDKHDVFSKVTYSPSFRDKFLDCYRRNNFKYSITAYWGAPTKPYRNRVVYTKLSEKIPDSNLVIHNRNKSVDMNSYYEALCCSKFGIAIRGGAKFSHREMELSSIGMPWFSEDRGQRFFKPLIPNEHYILTTRDTFLDVFEYYDNHYEEALKIGENAHAYFKKWHNQRGLQSIFLEIVNLIKHRS